MYLSDQYLPIIQAIIWTNAGVLFIKNHEEQTSVKS